MQGESPTCAPVVITSNMITFWIVSLHTHGVLGNHILYDFKFKKLGKCPHLIRGQHDHGTIAGKIRRNVTNDELTSNV